MKDEWKGHETQRFPHTSRQDNRFGYCLSLLFGRPVVSISLTYVRTSYTALLHVGTVPIGLRLTLIDYVIRVLPSDSSFKIRERPRPMNQEMSLRTPDPLSAFREGLGTRLTLA